ncbi:MAG: helix-turn-helix domain-containing protein [Acidobacteriia bacterium]|nr:helix-turn-helix domain-containing protein [Terriglobia bacterium]
MVIAPKLGIVQAGQVARLEPNDILTPKQLAKRLQVPVSWVYKHTDNSRSNRLPVLRCDGFLRFSWPDVCEWLRSNTKA